MSNQLRQVLHVVVLAAGLSISTRIMAGDLNPSDVPGPTMHTLEQIYNQQIVTTNMLALLLVPLTLSDTTTVVRTGYYAATTLNEVDTDLKAENIATNVTCFGITGTLRTNVYAIAVPKTGQTATLPLNPAPTDSDGALQKGALWPSPRFTDNTNGTVTDNLTGLIWLKNANAFGGQAWTNALTDCATLKSGEQGLTDGSVEGAWRLPNVRELQSLIDYGRYDPALPSGHPFTGVPSDRYWSSSTFAGSTDLAWCMYVRDGHANDYNKTGTLCVWPVRGGQ